MAFSEIVKRVPEWAFKFGFAILATAVGTVVVCAILGAQIQFWPNFAVSWPPRLGSWTKVDAKEVATRTFSMDCEYRATRRSGGEAYYFSLVRQNELQFEVKGPKDHERVIHSLRFDPSSLDFVLYLARLDGSPAVVKGPEQPYQVDLWRRCR